MSKKNLSFLLGDVMRLMRREYQKKELPLTPMQSKALLTMSRYEGIRQVALAELLDIQPIAIARLIDQLAENDLVERRPDPTDRRAYCLYLKEAADERLTSINKIIAEVRDKAFAGLTEQQIDVFIELLETIYSNLSTESTDTKTK